MAEGQKAIIDENTCTGCGICVDACPQQAIAMVDGLAKVDLAKCDGDGKCVEACPVEAISLK
ncbi:4Fe-4S binding protein [Candidatus Margulisiibacteriota bacterium]